MELILLPFQFVSFRGSGTRASISNAITKTFFCVSLGNLSHVKAETTTEGSNADVNWKSSRDISIEMLFGASNLARKLKM